MPQPLSITEAARQIHLGGLTPLEIVRGCLDRIEKYEDRLHAWVEVDAEGALKSAEALGREEPRGPLHGIPLGIKDVIDVAGLPTRAGSPLREDHVARRDAPLVAALRQAGAIILGKTVTVEFACFDPSPTRNPWDPTLVWQQPTGKSLGVPSPRTPGGSSSGSAAAVAMGMCLGSIGTQTGGSLVRPAGYCGIAACKPTFGRIDTEGVIPVSRHLDHPGPMARSVGDLKVLLTCLLDSDGSSTRASSKRQEELSEAPRLGFLEQFFMEEASEEIREVTRTAIDELRHEGAAIETLVFPDGFEQVEARHRRIMAVEAAAYHRKQFTAAGGSYGPKIASLLEEGLQVSAVDYAESLADQRAFRRRIADFLGLSGVAALIMPAIDTTAPETLETTGSPKLQVPWSYAGLPVVSIPIGPADDGMPSAIQLVGQTDREAALLKVAQWCECRVGLRALPPLWE